MIDPTTQAGMGTAAQGLGTPYGYSIPQAFPGFPGIGPGQIGQPIGTTFGGWAGQPQFPQGAGLGAQAQRFAPINIPPGVPGYGYPVPPLYPFGFGGQQLGFGGPQLGLGLQAGFGGQQQIQPQLQVLPVLTLHGWVPCLLAIVGPPVGTGLGQQPPFAAVPGIAPGFSYGFAPPIQAQPQFGQAPLQQQIPWQQQTGVSPFVGQPFAAGPSFH